MQTKLDFQQFANLLMSVEHYKTLPDQFTRLDPDQKERLETFWDKTYPIVGRWDYINADKRNWDTPDIHLIKQLWPSTARGWGGIGGAAMSFVYSVVIVNHIKSFTCVYWDGKLAYIVENDEKLKKYEADGYIKLPGLYRLDNELTVIYKNLKR